MVYHLAHGSEPGCCAPSYPERSSNASRRASGSRSDASIAGCYRTPWFTRLPRTPSSSRPARVNPGRLAAFARAPAPARPPFRPVVTHRSSPAITASNAPPHPRSAADSQRPMLPDLAISGGLPPGAASDGASSLCRFVSPSLSSPDPLAALHPDRRRITRIAAQRKGGQRRDGSAATRVVRMRRRSGEPGSLSSRATR